MAMAETAPAKLVNLSNSELDMVKLALSDLIYITGKQRTLSHRLILHASLLSICEDVKTRELYHKMQQDRAEFARVSGALMAGDSEMRIPELAINILWSSGKADRRTLDLMRDFQRRCNVLFTGGEDTPPTHIDQRWLVETAEFVSGPLMTGLSDLTFGVRNTLNLYLDMETARAVTNRNLTHSATTELKRMSKAVQMLAINAKVESHRLGEAGAAMQFVADEMTKLSKNVRDFSQKISSYVDDKSES